MAGVVQLAGLSSVQAAIQLLGAFCEPWTMKGTVVPRELGMSQPDWEDTLLSEMRSSTIAWNEVGECGPW